MNSGRVQRGGRCGLGPAGGKPYVITSGSNPEINCPNPKSHGFLAIGVSKKNPVPELN
jgi:hypothetical protein